jgi:hypothetical protein
MYIEQKSYYVYGNKCVVYVKCLLNALCHTRRHGNEIEIPGRLVSEFG